MNPIDFDFDAYDEDTAVNVFNFFGPVHGNINGFLDEQSSSWSEESEKEHNWTEESEKEHNWTEESDKNEEKPVV